MPKDTIWELGPHTIGKHRVLRNYLEAWFAIIGKSNERMVFIDGFAGPGVYDGGEPGSPLIALRTYLDHRSRSSFRAEAVFLFVDGDRRRTEHLSRVIDVLRPELPSNVIVRVETGKFDETMTAMLDEVEGVGKRLAPTFLMADPFGLSDTPMSVIRRILRHPQSEVYISFMYDWISRFRREPSLEEHFDELFGCRDWREAIPLTDPSERRDFFFDLYSRQLRAAGAFNVLQFELFKANRLIYAIFFGTKHLTGCDKMKEAMWRVDRTGEYRFRGRRGEQLELEVGTPDFGRFGRELAAAFAEAAVRVEELDDFARSDRTSFRKAHVRRALRLLEDNGQIEVVASPRKNRAQYPAGTVIRFIRS